MVDYLAWSKADPLTAEQAARLWAEVDPSTPSYALTPAQSAVIAARLQMLAGKIAMGALKADTRANALAFIGRHETSLILRSELKALAISLDERPLFLFVHSPEEPSNPSASAPEEEAGAKNAQQPSNEPPSGIAAFKGLFGDGTTKGPSAGPTPIRIIPGARRLSSAPPPPLYLRGTIGPLPTHPLSAVSQKVPPPIPVGRRGAAVPINDEAMLSEMRMRAAKDGDAFSVRSFVLENESRISGLSLEAKVRRLQRKYDEAKS